MPLIAYLGIRCFSVEHVLEELAVSPQAITGRIGLSVCFAYRESYGQPPFINYVVVLCVSISLSRDRKQVGSLVDFLRFGFCLLPQP